MVSWASLNLALQSIPHPDQRCIILFIHNKLPLCASKFHPHLGSTLCPLECAQTECWTLCTQLKMDLNAIVVKYRLHPSILTTFWLGILAIWNDTTYPQIEAELPPALQPVFCSQTRLR